MNAYPFIILMFLLISVRIVFGPKSREYHYAAEFFFLFCVGIFLWICIDQLWEIYGS